MMVAENTEKSTTKTSARKRAKIGPWTIARRIVQCGVLVLFAIPIISVGWQLFGQTAGTGASAGAAPAQTWFFGTLTSSNIAGLNLLDPFAVLQITVASKTFDISWLLYALPVLIVYTAIRGRVFCGWVCPVNLVLEFVDWLRRLLKIQVKETAVPRHVKLYVALGVLVLSAVFCVPVYEIFNPIGAINKLIAYGATAGLITLICIIAVELFWGHRVWCRSLCPLGGFYECLGKVGLAKVKIDHEACIHCGKCQKVCLCDSEILAPALDGAATAVYAGDCMLCGKCVDACPTRALHVGVGAPVLGKCAANEAHGADEAPGTNEAPKA